MGVDSDEAFTIAMLQDFGLLALMIMNPQHSQQWVQLHLANPDERRHLENEIFDTTHDKVGAIIAAHWNLPEVIATPIATHPNSYIFEVPSALPTN